VQEYVGYRTRKRQEQKKKSRGWLWIVAVVAIIAILVILGAVVKVNPLDKAWNRVYRGMSWMGAKIKAAWPWKAKARVPASKWLPEGKKTTNYLIAVTKQIDGATVLTTPVLASYDSVSGSGSLIYFPNDLMVSVPGLGMEQLNALVYLDESRIGMTLVTIENLLGIQIDKYILATDRDLRIVLNQMGNSFLVTVPAKTSYKDPSLNTEVKLSRGRQNVSANELASYLTYAPGGKEIELCRRQIDFTPEFLKISRGMFGRIAPMVKKDANLLDTDASDLELTGLWQTYALLTGGRLQQGILPVKEFKFESTMVHRVDQEKLAPFVKKYVKSPSTRTTSKRYKVEILNGNGVPGVGEQVASKLDLDKFQVVNSANADSFDHPDTVILLYSNDPDQLRAAEQIRSALEIGRIEWRDKAQDVADITILVGKDYAQK
jgi:hypothetical protein